MTKVPPKKPRVLSGIQPSGSLHLGNYLGAIQHWVRRQDERENFICIVDLHAITVRQEPDRLRGRTRELAAMLFACGIDVERTTLFVQSHVRAHCEGAWILTCLTPLSWLEKMTQYKSKSAKQKKIQTGILVYPVLQAADILLYDADEVPVGEDQKQHVELARNLAQRFNHRYGDTFVVPAPVIPKAGARVMGLDDPTSKMSKSESSSRGHAVLLTDSDAEIERSLKRAVTDSGREIDFSNEPDRAGVNNLLNIYQAITGKSQEDVVSDFADARGYGDLKKAVAAAVIQVVAPIRERYDDLISGAGELDLLLARGAERAREVAEAKIAQVKEKVGFLPAT